MHSSFVLRSPHSFPILRLPAYLGKHACEGLRLVVNDLIDFVIRELHIEIPLGYISLLEYFSFLGYQFRIFLEIELSIVLFGPHKLLHCLLLELIELIKLNTASLDNLGLVHKCIAPGNH